MEEMFSKSEYPVLKFIEETSPNWLILTETLTITEKDKKVHSKWKFMDEMYKTIESNPRSSWLPKAMHSILNSIVYSQRFVFAITKERTSNLLRNDKNWEKPISLSNKKYTKSTDGQPNNETYYGILLWSLCDRNIIELIEEPKKNKPGIYRLKDENVRKMIEVKNEEEQMQEVFNFINKNNTLVKEPSEEPSEEPSKGVLERKKDRKEESKKLENSTSSETSTKEIELENVTIFQLFKEEFGFGKGCKWKDIKDNMDSLASLAVENLGIENCTKNDFLRFLKKTTNDGKFKTKKSQKGWSQKEWADSLADNFEEEVESYVYNTSKHLKIKQPKTIEKKQPVLNTKTNNSDPYQEKTLNMLKNSFKNPTIEAIKNRMKNVQDQEELDYYKNQLKLIERIS